MGVGQAQCKTQAEEREDHPEDHLEDHPEDHPEDRLGDHLDHPGPHKNGRMVVVQSRMVVLMFGKSSYEVHHPETSE